ncbi:MULTISPECIES: flavodoxin family protein [unclassified Adlercreutzia]|uniref:flavodoxin family protein n=1 Tax=unclassified Adlercreutzia TaxID=2636013 RepID=UPI0013EB82BE|nr:MULTISPECIES: flavodoxin family protein [unclassified Adlercreutzia]
MKVLMFNGSPRPKSNTGVALAEIAGVLNAQGIETEVINVGVKPVRGCIACGKCASSGRCVFDDVVNDALAKLEDADGYVFGTPVYYASPNGNMVSFMDRLFFAGGAKMAYKPAACVAVARRAGCTTSYDMMNKYIGINNMIMVPSSYWNDCFGRLPGEAAQDEEGLSVMRGIGVNMAWLLKLLELGRENGLPAPTPEPKALFSFIR